MTSRLPRTMAKKSDRICDCRSASASGPFLRTVRSTRPQWMSHRGSPTAMRPIAPARASRLRGADPVATGKGPEENGSTA